MKKNLKVLHSEFGIIKIILYDTYYDFLIIEHIFIYVLAILVFDRTVGKAVVKTSNNI